VEEAGRGLWGVPNKEKGRFQREVKFGDARQRRRGSGSTRWGNLPPTKIRKEIGRSDKEKGDYLLGGLNSSTTRVQPARRKDGRGARNRHKQKEHDRGEERATLIRRGEKSRQSFSSKTGDRKDTKGSRRLTPKKKGNLGAEGTSLKGGTPLYVL